MRGKGKMVLVISLVLALLAGAGAGALGERPSHPVCGLIRLHVLANSDSPVDQALKLRVRDAVVGSTAPLFRQARTPAEAREIALANLELIREVAEREVRAAGKDYPVTVSWGRYRFPERTYPSPAGSLTLPEGDYEAVRIVLGRGEGANWWCVLFPPLCFVDFRPGGSGSALPGDPGGSVPLGGADHQPAFKWLDGPGVVRVPAPAGGAVEFRIRLAEVLGGSGGRLKHPPGS
ncbi:stage II sporulation protein R [Desulfovirgula thermocuniculi]|uniref:stage II sporulation protein R n=1 Tax=Desulfovirgula thermocuniculi TaxID=348842 RepID=UPI000A04E008|nr:stage II sporulation protein R [Desulfovirgula thermocuniculi]